MTHGSIRGGSDFAMSSAGVQRFAESPRHALAAGAGGVRDLWVERDDVRGLQWQLQLVELRGPHGLIQLPEDTDQLIVGISGAQVNVQADNTRPAPLRRDQALLSHASFVDFHRPGIRGIGLSRVLVLSSAASLADATFDATAADGDFRVSPSTLALVVLRGGVKVGSVAAGRESAIIFDSAEPLSAVATSAQVLRFARPS
ncbi:hypothetical protein LTA6_001430 [Microbacterium sp. LTA6]|uniref:hypothetical protein n=1 Tax=unclassified Microbacterium TaxID=2609290 RepID=UPI003138F88D